MPYNDGIPRARSFSLGDFHDFDSCKFKFFVFHYLEKKYELSEATRALALGSLLDQSIKHFHKAKMYGCASEELEKAVRMGASFIRGKIGQSQSPSFFSGVGPYLGEDLILEASKIFQDYYKSLDRKIPQSLYEKEFCDLVIDNDGSQFKLWGGADAYEMGEDGIPEVVDYKYRSNNEAGKENIDMHLMPKIYIVLASKELKSRGFEKVRFKVKFWQDPKEEGFFEEFDLGNISYLIDFFREKIGGILNDDQVSFCEKGWCRVCKSEKREDFLNDLQKRGFIKMSGEEFLGQMSPDLPF